jgi:ADP-ribose pyrophosphatase
MSEEGESLAWETRERSVAYSCPGFDVLHETVVLPDGSVTAFDFCSEPAAVVVLGFTDAGEVVVIEEWRQAVGRVNRGLPAGSVEADDDDLGVAARREFREETGYAVESIAPLCSVEPANGLLDSVHHVFVATGCERAGAQSLDVDESIRVDTTDFESLLAAVRAGEIRDGRTHAAVTRYALERELAAAPDQTASELAPAAVLAERDSATGHREPDSARRADAGGESP